MLNSEIQVQLNEIKKRNQRVEADKAWETSWTRKILVAVMTYLVITLFLIMIKAEHAFTTAVVPTVGFLISTASISFVKKIWLKYKKVK
jgi:preprotein translocase subunit SecF